MRTSVLAACLALALLCVQGCAWYQSLYTGQKLTVRSDENADQMGGIRKKNAQDNMPEIQPLDLDTARFPLGNPCNEFGYLTAYIAASQSAACRNALADHLIGLSDQMCDQHRTQIKANASAINATASALTSTLGGIGGLVTGKDAARILSGSAGITSALHSNINENVYQNQLASGILKQIENQRKAKLDEIRAHYNESPGVYSADRMVAEINNYNNLCSFTEALANLGNEAKRPLTKDEIRGQIRMLVAEIKDNNNMITTLSTSPGNQNAVTKLQDSNTALAARIASLQVSLAPEASSSRGVDDPSNGADTTPAKGSTGSGAGGTTGSGTGGTTGGGTTGSGAGGTTGGASTTATPQ